MLQDPANAERQRLVREGVDPEIAWQAVRWSTGIAYYSFLREMYALAALRDAGIAARYHVVPDVLWRVDLWVDDLCLELFVHNAEFKASEDVGRKTTSAAWLGDGPFEFVKLEMAKQAKFGVVHLPDAGDLVRLVAART
jgi:hypothetical protein